MCADGVEAEAGPGGDHVYRDLASDLGDLGGDGVGIALEVSLREQDYRSRAALPGEREVALEDAYVHVLGERGCDEDDVDVRGDDLLAGRLRAGVVGGTAREPGAARKDRPDRGASRLTRIESDPVTDDGQFGERAGLVAQASWNARANVPIFGDDVPLAAMLHRHAPGHEPLCAVGLEGGVPGVVPAERREIWHTRIVPDG